MALLQQTPSQLTSRVDLAADVNINKIYDRSEREIELEPGQTRAIVVLIRLFALDLSFTRIATNPHATILTDIFASL